MKLITRNSEALGSHIVPNTTFFAENTMLGRGRRFMYRHARFALAVGGGCMLGGISKVAARLAKFVGAISVLTLASAAFGQSATLPEGRSVIDCTGTMAPTPGVNLFSGFNDYLQKIGPTGTVYVNGPCPGNFQIWGGDNFTIIGPAEIDGNISIGHSESAVFFKNLTITQSTGDGVDISGSKVSFDSCNVSNNAGNGVSINNASHVVVVGNGKFNSNRGNAGGFRVGGHSFLNIVPSGPVEIRGNSQSGIWASQADIATSGNTTISDNVNGPGIYLLGGARAQFGDTVDAPNVIENNPNGGISVLENSEMSLWVCCSQNAQNFVRKNGKFGISAGFHSQVTLSGAEISQNSGPGVDVYAGSQLDFFPATQNRIVGNGALLSSPSPGVRVNGNSQAWLHGGEISNSLGSLGLGNQAPGIQVVINSSVDLAGVNLGINAGGSTTGAVNSNGITCDFTSVAVSDLVLNWSTGCILGGRLH